MGVFVTVFVKKIMYENLVSFNEYCRLFVCDFLYQTTLITPLIYYLHAAIQYLLSVPLTTKKINMISAEVKFE